MASFLRILQKITMFSSKRKRGNAAKQTIVVEKAPKSVSSGNLNSNKKEYFSLGRGRVALNGTITEKEFENLHHRIDKLLAKLDDSEIDGIQAEEEECVVCLTAKATMQTFPCGHKIVCRKCFIKTIQVALSQRCLPLRCVICRTAILKVRQTATHQKSKKLCQTSHASRFLCRAKSKKPPSKGK
ncbi:uncharacterized protein LOC133202262 isoform X1 [Saccostrea echinata]|uniref:uncharacterized protein LOC133202262 isoform X1 n=1 Tax=Saccostrea echinata TaxID=191078 RepID=UPI002A80DF48|nr:uncharacterized protein LOC133202262 isoform X1 [Saccostrea echinata]